MGNCRGAPSTLGSGGKNRRIPNANPYTVAYNCGAWPLARGGLVVPRDLTGRNLDDKYVLGEELDPGEFGITYLCTEAAMGARMACKSISNRKLRTPSAFPWGSPVHGAKPSAVGVRCGCDGRRAFAGEARTRDSSA